MTGALLSSTRAAQEQTSNGISQMQLYFRAFTSRRVSRYKKAGSEEAAIMFAPSSTITVTKDKIEIKKDDTKITVASDSIKVEKGGTTVTASSSSVDVTSPSLNIKGNTKVNGDISVTGNVTISGTLTLGGIVMNTHTHVGVHGPTGGPV